MTQILHFFQNFVKEIRSRNNILSLYTSENVKLVDGKKIAEVRIDYYSDLFRCADTSSNISTSAMGLTFNACIQQDEVADLIKPVTREEVIIALNSIGSSTAPGPDGFSIHFFKACWPIVGMICSCYS